MFLRRSELHYCKDAGKHPLTLHGLKDATNDPDILAQQFSGEYSIANIGLRTGKISGVWVLDVDDVADLRKLELQYGKLPLTWQAQTGGGGLHYFFRYPTDCEIRNSQKKIAPNIDVRGEGGYVVLPPGKHKSGGAYTWLVSPESGIPLSFASPWLIDLATGSNIKHTPPDPKASASAACAAEGRGTGKGESGEPIYTGSFPLSPSLGVHTIGEGDVSSRLVCYLRSTPPAIEGDGGNLHTWTVFCRCVELFGSLDDDAFIAASAEWNERCVPPWPEDKLRDKLRRARMETGVEAGEDRSAPRGRAASMPAPVVDPVPTDRTTELISDDDDTLTLHPDAYCGLVGEIVRAVDPHTEADPVGVTLSLLACFGSAVGNGPRFSVGHDSHGTNLFVALVGDTASGKGQAWNIARRLISEGDPEFSENCIAYGLASGEGLVDRLADPEDDEDSSPTIPKPKRLLCVETEFARPMAACRREGSTLSPILRSAWDGQTLEVMTRGRSKLKATVGQENHADRSPASGDQAKRTL